jgi:hypothetical protein
MGSSLVPPRDFGKHFPSRILLLHFFSCTQYTRDDSSLTTGAFN